MCVCVRVLTGSHKPAVSSTLRQSDGGSSCVGGGVVIAGMSGMCIEGLHGLYCTLNVIRG